MKTSWLQSRGYGRFFIRFAMHTWHYHLFLKLSTADSTIACAGSFTCSTASVVLPPRSLKVEASRFANGLSLAFNMDMSWVGRRRRPEPGKNERIPLLASIALKTTNADAMSHIAVALLHGISLSRQAASQPVFRQKDSDSDAHTLRNRKGSLYN
jgi:hypothetical protein